MRVSTRITLVFTALLCPVVMTSAQDLQGSKVPFRIEKKSEALVPGPPSEGDGELFRIISPRITEGMPYYSPSEKLELVGKVNTASGVQLFTVNSQMVELTESGAFSSSIQLVPGQNLIRISVLDNNDQLNEEILRINYQAPVVNLEDRIRQESVYYGLIIGIENYNDPGLPDLDNPIEDADKLYAALTYHYCFDPENTILLKDASRSDIIRSFDELTQKITEDDNLLIFYAGHGWWDENANNGYWLPSDARQGDKTNWVRNSTIVDYLQEIKSRHTLLIADACFGGSIFKTRAAFGKKDQAFERLYDLPSRKAMTSGTLTEVPDRSSFTKYLVERLAANQETYLSSEQLFSSFRIAVINNSDAIPQFGEISDVGDQGGDFIFLKRK